MKKYLLFTLLLVFNLSLLAQSDFKYSPAGAKKLHLENIHSKVVLEAHSGSDIIIQSSKEYKLPEEVNGLKAITLGVEDNTNKGLNIQKVGDVVRIVGARRNLPEYKILVPQSMHLFVKSRGTQCGNVHMHKFSSEVEADVQYNSIYLEDVTGPIVAKSSYGKVVAQFSQLNPEKPSSLVSAYGAVDITLPNNAKANLVMESSYGDIYSNVDLEYEQNDQGFQEISGKHIKAKMNGGGAEVYLKSPYGNIYLRKKNN